MMLTYVYRCYTILNTVRKEHRNPPNEHTPLNLTTSQHPLDPGSLFSKAASIGVRFAATVLRHAVAGFLGIVILYLSMVTTSAPMSSSDMRPIDRAIAVLESRGFDREGFLLRHTATFRG